MLTGEYWFCPDGRILRTTDCTNHMTYAIVEAAQRLITRLQTSDVYGARELSEVLARGDLTDAIALRTVLLDVTDSWARHDPRWVEPADDVDAYLEQCGVPQPLLAALFSRSVCPRAWAAQYCHWIHVRNRRASLYGVTDAKLRRLRDGLWKVCDEEAPGRPIDSQTAWVLYDCKVTRSADMTWAELQHLTTRELHWRTTCLEAALPGG